MTTLKRPIFLVGSPRSGTTLLQSMLMRLPGVHFPPETQFFGRTSRRVGRYGPLHVDDSFEKHLSAILESCRLNELPVDPVSLEQELRTGPRTFPGLFRALLMHIAARRPDLRRLGEKTPNHIMHVPEILEAFPDAQIITIIRDGRDCAESQKDAFGEPLLSSAIRWRHYQRLHARWSSELAADAYTSVRYEDLVRDPEKELRRLCSFLDEEFRADLLDPTGRTETGFAQRETHKLRTLEPVTATRIARYRSTMRRRDVGVFQFIAGPQLEENGYELEQVNRAMAAIDALFMAPSILLRRWRFFRNL